MVRCAAQCWFRRDPLRSRIVRGLHDEGLRLYRFLPASRLGRPLEGLRLHHTVEQAPNPDSRISLGPERDSLGLHRVRLDWRASPLEPFTFQRSIELLGEAFGNAKLGRLVLEPQGRGEDWPPRPLQGMRGHHMGTTRMSREPRHGVVDEHCRVHGVENLFIAGSSVFPTAGVGTPTLTIIALALRLADHVKSLMRNAS
jgi:choline dehydrogenase-like flavoprotein